MPNIGEGALSAKFAIRSTSRYRQRKEYFSLGKTGKLSPRYLGPYEILERIGLIAYRLDLLAEFQGIHDIFHYLPLRKVLESRH